MIVSGDIFKVAELLGNLTKQPAEADTPLGKVPVTRRSNLIRAARIAFRFLENNEDPYEKIEDLRAENAALLESFRRVEARIEQLDHQVTALASGPSLIA